MSRPHNPLEAAISKTTASLRATKQSRDYGEIAQKTGTARSKTFSDHKDNPVYWMLSAQANYTAAAVELLTTLVELTAAIAAHVASSTQQNTISVLEFPKSSNGTADQPTSTDQPPFEDLDDLPF